MDDLQQLRVDLLSNFFLFNRFIFKERTGRDFIVSRPVSNISHFIEICNALEDVFYGRVKHLLINCPPGWSKCIDLMTRVMTKRGFIYAKDILIGDEVYTYDNGHLTTESCLSTELTSKLAKKISLRSGREITCSDDHRMLTSQGYIEAKDIMVGERIRALNCLVDGDIEVDHDELTFITLMIFEGCCMTPSIRFSNQDRVIVDLFYNTCFNLGFKAKNYGKSLCDHHILQGVESKKNLRALLEKYNILNKRSHEKRLPHSWFALPERQKLWFIDLMIATDGYIDAASGCSGIALANRGLIEDIQQILSSLKIPSTFYFKPNKYKGAWCLKIGRFETQKLLDKITFFHKRKNAELSLLKTAYSGINNYPNSILDNLSDRLCRRNGIRIDNKKDINPERFERLCAIYPNLEKYRNIDFYWDEVIRVEDVGLKELIHLQINRTENFIANGLVSHNSEIIKNFICWGKAWYPESNELYISFAHELASSHTHTIKQTIQLPIYKRVFGVEINRDSSAKDFFKTSAGGETAAFGSSGPVTGRNAGLPGLKHYSGGVFVDDIHKPDEVHSDVIREKVKRNFIETIAPRCRGYNVPIVVIGQRLHQDDLFNYLLNGEDGNKWTHVNIKALDDSNNARYPEVMPKETLITMRQYKPYVFASQYQQDPIPAGGGLYKEEYFPLLDECPDILATFITVDTAETEKDWNDKTVFSFFGLYQIKYKNESMPDLFALHWLDCRELQIEPKDLESEFMDFWASCMRFNVKPQCAIIEKKSTGVTLVSVLKNVQGLKVIGIDRTAKSGSKAQRFIDMQQYIAAKQVSLPSGAKHTKMCIDHMTDITANNTHKFDDICFVAGTKIATLFGYKNIELINTKDLIITPFGIRRVLASGLTKRSLVINNIGLTGTDNHQVYTNNSFKRLDTVCDADKIERLSLMSIIRWKYLKLLFLMESNINLQGREDIILAGRRNIKKGKALKDFTWQFMNFIADRKFLKAILFITKTITLITMSLIIWSVFQGSNISNYMLMKGKIVYQLIKNWSIWQGLEIKPKFGMLVKKVKNGIAKTLKHLSISQKNLNADFVGEVLLGRQLMQESVASCVEGESVGLYEKTSSQIASYAEMNSQEKNLFQPVEIEKHALHYASQEQEVYNLTVDKDHVYYANGILVSNCDTAYDAVNATFIDKIIVHQISSKVNYNQLAENMMQGQHRIDFLRTKAHGSGQTISR